MLPLNYSGTEMSEIAFQVVPKVVTSINCPPNWYLTVEVPALVTGVLGANKQNRWYTSAPRRSPAGSNPAKPVNEELMTRQHSSGQEIPCFATILPGFLSAPQSKTSPNTVCNYPTASHLTRDSIDGRRKNDYRPISEEKVRRESVEEQEIPCFATILPGFLSVPPSRDQQTSQQKPTVGEIFDEFDSPPLVDSTPVEFEEKHALNNNHEVLEELIIDSRQQVPSDASHITPLPLMRRVEDGNNRFHVANTNDDSMPRPYTFEIKTNSSPRVSPGSDINQNFTADSPFRTDSLIDPNVIVHIKQDGRRYLFDRQISEDRDFQITPPSTPPADSSLDSQLNNMIEECSAYIDSQLYRRKK